MTFIYINDNSNKFNISLSMPTFRGSEKCIQSINSVYKIKPSSQVYYYDAEKFLYQVLCFKEHNSSQKCTAIFVYSEPLASSINTAQTCDKHIPAPLCFLHLGRFTQQRGRHTWAEQHVMFKMPYCYNLPGSIFTSLLHYVCYTWKD